VFTITNKMLILLFAALASVASADCRAEYHNAVNNKNLAHFWNRCNFDSSFRSRCSLCAGSSSPQSNKPSAQPTTIPTWVRYQGACAVSDGRALHDALGNQGYDFHMITEQGGHTLSTCQQSCLHTVDCSSIQLMHDGHCVYFRGSLISNGNGASDAECHVLNALQWTTSPTSSPTDTPTTSPTDAPTPVATATGVSCHDFGGYYMADGWDGDLSLSIYQREDCTAKVCHWGGDDCENNVLATEDSIMGSTLNERGEIVAHFHRDTVNFIRIKKEYCDQENYPCSEPGAYCGFGVNKDKCWCGNPDFPYACNKPLEDQWIMFKVDGTKSCSSECNAMGLTCSNNSPAIDTRDAIDAVVESLGGQCLYFRGPWKGAWSPGYRPADGRCMMKRQANGQHCDKVLAYNPSLNSENFDERKLCYCSVEN